MDSTIPSPRDSFASIFLPSAEELLVSMPHTLKHMYLDLIRCGVLAEPTENDTFPLQDLIPLLQFRQLRTLTIVGMLDSYQSQIWETAWLCPHLEVLTLEMCLEPSIRTTRSRDWPTIQGDWKMKSLSKLKRHYYGYMGHGQLHHEIGYGELLDSLAIGLAQRRAKKHGPVTDKLSIATLNLTNFVVDADPFVKWFASGKLRDVIFDGFCVDAGFTLPLEMLNQVKVSIPTGAIPRVVMAKKYMADSVKLITIGKGRKAGKNKAGGGEHFGGKHEAEADTPSGSSGTSTAAGGTAKYHLHKKFTNSSVFNGLKRGLEPSFPPFVNLAAKMEAALRRRALEARVKAEVERLERQEEIRG